VDEGRWHIFVEEIAHRVDEDHLRLLPLKRKVENVWVESETEAVPIVRLTHRFKPLRHSFGIAVLAARAYLGTTGEWIPR
jgi:hypothetical protein